MIDKRPTSFFSILLFTTVLSSVAVAGRAKLLALEDLAIAKGFKTPQARIYDYKRASFLASKGATSITLNYNGIEILEVATLYRGTNKLFSGLEVGSVKALPPFGEIAGKLAGLDVESNYHELNRLSYWLKQVLAPLLEAGRQTGANLETIRATQHGPVEGTLIQLGTRLQNSPDDVARASHILERELTSPRQLESANSAIKGSGFEFKVRSYNHLSKSEGTDGL